MIPIFMYPQKPTISYEALYELAHLSGFSILKGDSERQEGYCYIQIMYHQPLLSGTKGKTILWFIERPSLHGGLEGMKKYLESEKSKYNQIWISDRTLADYCKDFINFVPIGSHEGLAYFSDHKKYDLVDLCHTSNRRHIISAIHCSRAPNTYNLIERANILSQTKFLLNIHQFDDPYFEPLRFAIATAAGLPIISETCVDPYPYEAPGLSQFSYDKIAQAVEKIIEEDYIKYKEAGRLQREYILKNFNFKDNVNKAVALLD